MSSEEEWSKADPKTREIPWRRYVYGASGAIRRPLGRVGDLESPKVEGDLRLLVEDHYSPIPSKDQELLAPERRLSPTPMKPLGDTSFRTWSKEAVLLPEDWEPGQVVPDHPTRLKRVEEKKKREALWAQHSKELEERLRKQEEARKALEAHFEQQWEDSKYVLVSFQNDAFNQADVGQFKQEPRAKNWVARVWADPSAPGGLGREFLNRVPGNYPAVIVDRVRPGDYLEVAADEVSYGGRRSQDRLYFRVIWETLSRGRAVILFRLEGKPPLKLDEPSLSNEMENLQKWLSEKGEVGKRISGVLG